MTDPIIRIDGVFKSFGDPENTNGGFIRIDDGALLPARETCLHKSAPKAAAEGPAVDLPCMDGLFFLAISALSAIFRRRHERPFAGEEFVTPP